MAKILVHNPYWNTLGGGERYTAAFVRLMLDLKHEVYLDYPEDMSKGIQDRFGINISEAVWNNASTADLTFWVSDGSLPTIMSGKTIIHFQFPFQNVDGKQMKNLLKSRFYKFVVNSGFTKKFIDQEFGVNSTVVYPAVNVDSFKPGIKKNQILYVARFSKLTQKKGHEDLIKYFAEISSQLKGWKLILAGSTDVGVDDMYLESLKQLSSGLPIKIIANPSFADIQNLYSTAKIFCSPSGVGIDEETQPMQVEHFGITVVESMAAGCVPVITRLGGHREIVEEGKNGFFWNTKEEFQKLLIDLSAQDLNTLSQAAVQRSKIFSDEVFRQKFKTLL
jgi:glycosyltransferase involved in cell wall biosynthesis